MRSDLIWVARLFKASDLNPLRSTVVNFYTLNCFESMTLIHRSWFDWQWLHHHLNLTILFYSISSTLESETGSTKHLIYSPFCIISSFTYSPVILHGSQSWGFIISLGEWSLHIKPSHPRRIWSRMEFDQTLVRIETAQHPQFWTWSIIPVSPVTVPDRDICQSNPLCLSTLLIINHTKSVTSSSTQVSDDPLIEHQDLLHSKYTTPTSQFNFSDLSTVEPITILLSHHHQIYLSTYLLLILKASGFDSVAHTAQL